MFIPLRYLSPRWLLVAGLASWVLARLSIFFVDYEATLSFGAAFALIGYTVAFLAGTYAFSNALPPGAPKRVVFTAKGYRWTADVLFVATFVFLVLRFYDLLFVRGLLEIGDAQQLRNIDNTIVGDERVTSGIGFISGIGYPIAIPTFVFGVMFRRLLARWQMIVGTLLFVLYASYVVASGSRYILIGPFSMAVLAYVIASGGFPLSKRKLGLTAVVALAGFVFLAHGTIQRDILFGAMTREDALLAAPDRKFFSVKPWFIEWFREQPAIVQDALAGQVELGWYVTHGMYEFHKTWDFANPDEKAWGGVEFATALYFFRMIGFDVPGEDVWRRNTPTWGFYSTFFGPLYLDFGLWAGMGFCAVLGVLLSRLWQGVQRSNATALLFYPYAATIVLNFWTSNLITAGLGVPIIAMTAVTAAITRICLSVAPRRLLTPQRDARAFRFTASR